MSMYGSLRTIILPDLLHWASSSRKTGILELERNKIQKSIAFRDGRIVACASSDPSSRLGQFLLARGKITQEELREALARQEKGGAALGAILREMGLLSEGEIERQIVAKAEEIVYSLFDWPDASFRFQEDVAMAPYSIVVDLAVEDILFEGIQRQEELEQVRRSFPSMGVVLGRTDRPAPAEVQTSPLASRILESVDGERTLAGILLCVHASEYQVIRFLYMLHRTGIVVVVAERPVEADAPTLLDARIAPTDPVIGADETSEGVDISPRDAAGPGRTHLPSEHDEAREAALRYPELSAAIEAAAELTQKGDHAACLKALNRCYRSHPGDGYLRHLIFKSEAAYMANLGSHGLSREMIPALTRPVQDVDQEKLRPTDSFLLGQIDGKSDIKAILWVVPMPEVDVYLALQQLRDDGLIELQSPETVDEEVAQPGAVLWT